MKNHLPLLFLLSTLLVSNIYVVAQGDAITIGEQFSLHSKVLSEDRPILIYKPANYQADGEPVPVLYLLDGRGHFHHTTGIVDFLARSGRIPEMLVVAIPNTIDRTRDLTPPLEVEPIGNWKTAGGADNMLKFIGEELIPHIDKNYNTHPYRILVGHSFGGLFAVHAFATHPGIFDAYLAISPSLWWDKQNLVAKAEAYLDTKPDVKGFLYMTMGNEGGAMLGGALKLAGVLEEKAPEKFDWDFKLMEEETHGSVPHRSTYYGLEAIFKGWDIGDPRKLYAKGGLEAIDKHYADLSDRFGYNMKTPESLINRLGYFMMGQNKMDDAVALFKANIDRYPKSFNVYDSMGEAYKVKGNKEKAIKLYKKSLELNPANVNGVKMLKEMGVDYDPAEMTIKLSAKTLKRYEGKYQINPEVTVELAVEEGKLKGTAPGMPLLDFLPLSKTRFLIKPLNYVVDFEQDSEKNVKGFSAQDAGGQELNAKRLD